MEPDSLLYHSHFHQLLCPNLSFEEMIKFRNALKIESLDCPIVINDPIDRIQRILPGVNEETIQTYRLIQELGANKALIYAANTDNYEVIKILIKLDLRPGVVQKVAFDAINFQRQSVLEILLDNGLNLETRNQNGKTLLAQAVYRGRYQISKYLIERGANVNAVDESGWTILMLAVWRNRFRIFPLLLKAGADINAISSLGDTALSLAIEENHHSIVKMLKEAGATQ